MIPRFSEGDERVRAVERTFRSAPLHWHTFYEIEMTVTGNVAHIVNGQVFRTSPGFVSLMTPCDFHQYVDSGCESRIMKVNFDDRVLTPELSRLILTMRVPRCAKPSPEDFGRLSALFGELMTFQSDVSEIGLLTQRNLVERLCLIIVASCLSPDHRLSAAAAEYDGTSLLNTALTYLSEHFTEKVTLEKVAAVVHLSPNYLSHLFSSSLGTTFSQYVKYKRISYAAVLLLTTDRPIDQIAYTAGFTSTSFFNTSFKAQYATSPFAYRNQYRRLNGA